MPIEGSWIAETIKHVGKYTTDWDGQLSILAHAFAIGCTRAKVEKDVALREMQRIIALEFARNNQVMQ